MDRDEEYHLKKFRTLLDTYSMEEIIESWSYYTPDELLFELYKQGYFHTKLKEMTMELDFSE